jgi:hypothetical protein
MTPEEQQKALVAFSSMAQGDINSFPVQLALFVKGAATEMQEAGKVIHEGHQELKNTIKDGSNLILKEFVNGIDLQKKAQMTLTKHLENVIPQVEKINKEMSEIPTSIEEFKQLALSCERKAKAAATAADSMNGKWFLLIIVFMLGAAISKWSEMRYGFDWQIPGAAFIAGVFMTFVLIKIIQDR